MNILPTDIKYEEFLGLQESQHVRPSTDYTEDLKERFRNGHILRGEKLPWIKTHDFVRLREGEVSVWAGINGSRKSMITGQVMLWLPPSQKIVIASLEMSPVDTLERMACQALGNNSPTESFIDTFTRLTNNIYLYDQQDTIPTDRILGMCAYMAQEEGADHILLDSLMKCVGGTDDYNGQKRFIDRLTWIARQYKTHIHIVHHARKGRSENDKLDKFDVKGAGEITDLCDNLFLVQQNKEKKIKLDKGEQVDKFEPDQILTVAKQRRGKWEGEIALYFRENGLQFVGGPDSQALPWRVETRYPEPA